MFGATFQNGTIRKHMLAFANLFNNIILVRTNGDEDKDQQQVVPIAHGGRDKYFARNQQDPNIERPVAAQLPRMAYELINLYYDPTRQLNPVNNIVNFNTTISSRQFVPTPYNYVFNLYITARNITDASQIAEQILPYFTPAFTVQAQFGTDECTRNLPITLDSIDMSDNYEGSMTDRRILIWTISFTMQGFMFGPTSNVAVIRWVNENIAVGTRANNDFAYSTNTYPTLANTALEDIDPSDPYTIVVDITDLT